MNLLELLAAGRVDDFNAQRAQRSRPDLFAADLSGVDLTGVDLAGVNLSKADLSGTVLTDANLVRADLSGIDGTGVCLQEALGVRTRFIEAWLEDAVLTGCDLSRASLAEACLVRSKGEGIRAVRANLRDVDAQDARWPESDLSEAQLQRADLTGADLTRSDLTDASASGVVLERARLDYSVATRSRLPGARLRGASLVGVRLVEANLADADLRGADLTAADLSRANLTGARLDGATLQGAVFAEACLDGVDFTGLDVGDLDMSGLDPVEYGLDDDQIEALAAWGTPSDPDAPRIIEDPVAATDGERVAVLWENPEGEDRATTRWALWSPDGVVDGLLPVPTHGVKARFCAAVAEGFVLVLVQQRPNGVCLVVYPLSTEGVLGRALVRTLGYSPATPPVFRVEGDALWIWGLTRRGPTAVVHRLLGETLTPMHSDKVPTALGFLGRRHPVLACKGGVLLPASTGGISAPLRAPDGSVGRRAVAVPHEDSFLMAWTEAARSVDLPGGLRVAEVRPRYTDRVDVLGLDEHVETMDAWAGPEGIVLAWTEGTTARTAWWAKVPGGARTPLLSDVEGIEEVRLATGDVPVVVATVRDRGLILVGPTTGLHGEIAGALTVEVE